MCTLALTQTQFRFVQAVASYIEAHRISPSYADLAKTLNVSTRAVHEEALRLEGKGVLGRVPKTARSLHLLQPISNLSPTTERSSGDSLDGGLGAGAAPEPNLPAA